MKEFAGCQTTGDFLHSFSGILVLLNSFGPNRTEKIKKSCFYESRQGRIVLWSIRSAISESFTSAIDFLMVQFRPRRTRSEKWNQCRWLLWAPIIAKASLSNLHFEKLSFTIANVPQASRKKKKNAIWAAVHAFNVLYLRTFSFCFSNLRNSFECRWCVSLHIYFTPAQMFQWSIANTLCVCKKFRLSRSKEMSFAKTRNKGWREESLVQVDVNSTPRCLRLSFWYGSFQI